MTPHDYGDWTEVMHGFNWTEIKYVQGHIIPDPPFFYKWLHHGSIAKKIARSPRMPRI